MFKLREGNVFAKFSGGADLVSTYRDGRSRDINFHANFAEELASCIELLISISPPNLAGTSQMDGRTDNILGWGVALKSISCFNKTQ